MGGGIKKELIMLVGIGTCNSVEERELVKMQEDKGSKMIERKMDFFLPSLAS